MAQEIAPSEFLNGLWISATGILIQVRDGTCTFHKPTKIVHEEISVRYGHQFVNGWNLGHFGDDTLTWEKKGVDNVWGKVGEIPEGSEVRTTALKIDRYSNQCGIATNVNVAESGQARVRFTDVALGTQQVCIGNLILLGLPENYYGEEKDRNQNADPEVCDHTWRKVGSTTSTTVALGLGTGTVALAGPHIATKWGGMALHCLGKVRHVIMHTATNAGDDVLVASGGAHVVSKSSHLFAGSISPAAMGIGYALVFVAESVYYIIRFFNDDISGTELAAHLATSLLANASGLVGSFGGALLGAAILSCVGPVGTIVGAIVGGLFGGLLLSYYARKKTEHKLKAFFEAMFNKEKDAVVVDALVAFGLPPDCTERQVRKNFNKLILGAHPDKNKGDESSAAMKSRRFIQQRTMLLQYVANREKWWFRKLLEKIQIAFKAMQPDVDFQLIKSTDEGSESEVDCDDDNSVQSNPERCELYNLTCRNENGHLFTCTHPECAGTPGLYHEDCLMNRHIGMQLDFTEHKKHFVGYELQ